jgi:hypothetical protein
MHFVVVLVLGAADEYFAGIIIDFNINNSNKKGFVTCYCDYILCTKTSRYESDSIGDTV